MDPRVEARLRQIRDELRPLMDRGDLTQDNLVSLLVDHWLATPPARAWTKAQANVYPGKGGSSWRR